jgi:uracil-DNA glycosylase family protein
MSKTVFGRPSARDLISPHASLGDLSRAAQDCRGCDIWQRATQAVMGEGATEAAAMFVGEQPGNSEDLEGHPFVGPAGTLLSKALVEAGIDRSKIYITNVVKHFNSTPRGKLRIHKKPNAEQIAACRPWLEAEIALVRPKILVCLGATAAQALIGRDFRVSRQHGSVMPSKLVPSIVATVHPSSILRSPDEKARHSAMRGFVNDLKEIARHLPAQALLRDPGRHQSSASG